MNTHEDSKNSGSAATPEQLSRTAWLVATAVLFIELIGAGVMLWVAVQGAATNGAVANSPTVSPEQPLADLLGLVLMTLLGLLAVLGALVGVFTRKGWVRAATVMLQFVALALGLGAFQGLIAPRWLGYVLIGLAIIGFVAALKMRASDQERRAE